MGVTISEMARMLADYKLGRELFHLWNNSGNGFSIGDIDDDINELDYLGITLVQRADHDTGVAIYADEGKARVLAVANLNGLWAVRIA